MHMFHTCNTGVYPTCITCVEHVYYVSATHVISLVYTCNTHKNMYYMCSTTGYVEGGV